MNEFESFWEDEQVFLSLVVQPSLTWCIYSFWVKFFSFEFFDLLSKTFILNLFYQEIKEEL